MSNIDCVAILKKSRSVAWENKKLWWFGAMVALSSGINVATNNYNADEKYDIAPEAWVGFIDFFRQNLGIIAVGAAIVILVMLIFATINIFGRAALIRALNFVEAGEGVSFKKGIRAGQKYFGKLFMVDLVLAIFSFIVLSILFLPVGLLIYLNAYLLAALVSTLAVIIFVPLMILAAYMRIYGTMYIVLAETGIRSALENAYRTLRNNLAASLNMGLWIIGYGIVFGVVISVAVAVLRGLFAAAGVGLNLLLGQAGVIVAEGLAIFLVTVVALVLYSGWEVFCQSVWIIFFRQVAGPRTEERVVETEVKIMDEKLPEPESV